MPNKLELVRVTEENEKSQSFDAVDHDQDLKMSGLEISTFNFIKDYLVALSEYVKENFE